MSEARLETAQSRAAHLTPEEAAEAIDSLCDEDKIRLRLIERRRLGGTDFADGMLLHEAICQAILGERQCPRGVPMVAFLAQTMRSLASHRRDELGRQIPLDEDSRAGVRAAVQIASDQLDPETTLIEKQATDLVTGVLDCVDGDEEAQNAVISIAGGLKGKALRDDLGVNQQQYDYIIKRIKNAVKKKHPKGFPQ